MEIILNIKGNEQQLTFDIEEKNVNDFKLIPEQMNKFLSALKSTIYKENAKGMNFLSGFVKKSENKKDYSFSIGGIAGCHESVTFNSNIKDEGLVISNFTEDSIKIILERILCVLFQLGEKNQINFPVLHTLETDFSSLAYKGKCYSIFIDFSNSKEYISNVTKKRLLLRLLRWSIACSENLDLNSIIGCGGVCESGSRKTTVELYKNHMIDMTNNWNSIPDKNYDLFLDIITDIYKDFLVLKKKVYYPLQLISRHPTHRPIAGLMVEKNAVLRLGLLRKEKNFDLSKKFVINSIEAVRNSASKFLMKSCFSDKKVRTAEYLIPDSIEELDNWASGFKQETKFIIKSEFGSRGTGLWLVNNAKEAIDWFSKGKMNGKDRLGNYLIERYYNYTKEYRIHVSKNGCFYTNRKMLKKDAQERWFRNDSNSVWILEENPMFEKPRNWNVICAECVKALNAVGLDIGACDVRVSKTGEFIICEINSAPSFGEITLEKYKNEITSLCAD